MRCEIYYNVSWLVRIHVFYIHVCYCETRLCRRENSVFNNEIGLKLNIFDELLLWNCLWVFLYRFGLCWYFKLKSFANDYNRSVLSSDGVSRAFAYALFLAFKRIDEMVYF